MDLGQASITPHEPVTAGSLGCWRLCYRVGERGIAAGGGVQLDTDSDTDWGELQFSDPAGLNFTTITTTGLARLSWLLARRRRY